MNEQNEEGLEFESEGRESPSTSPAHTSIKNDPELKRISRHSYRFPIDDTVAAKVRINGREFELVNLVDNNRAGIGILLLQERETFAIGEELTAIRLTLPEKTLNLQGTVIHISPDGLGNYLCGIEFAAVTEEDRQALAAFSAACRSRLLPQE